MRGRTLLAYFRGDDAGTLSVLEAMTNVHRCDQPPTVESIAREGVAPSAVVVDSAGAEELLASADHGDALCDALPVVLLGEGGPDMPALAGRLSASTEDALLDGLSEAIYRWGQVHQWHRQRLLWSLGRLATGIAHDLNNALTVILGNLELLQLDSADEEARAVAAESAGAAEKILTLARRLSRLSPGAGTPTHCELAELLALSAADAQQWLPEGIEIAVDAPLRCVALLDRRRMITVLEQLLQNAADATGGDGLLTLRLGDALPPQEDWHRRYISGGAGAGGAVITVEDGGEGMSRSQLLSVGEPFASERSGRGARGLGLAFVVAALQQEGGGLVIDSKPGQGSRVHCCVPGHIGEHVEMAARASVPRSLRILLVEDDAVVRRVMGQMLEKRGHSADGVENAYAALRWLSEHGAVDVLVSDVELTGTDDGYTLSEVVRDMHPDLPVLIVSGFPPGGDSPTQPFLAKPFSSEQLCAAVESLAESGSAG